MEISVTTQQGDGMNITGLRTPFHVMCLKTCFLLLILVKQYMKIKTILAQKHLMRHMFVTIIIMTQRSPKEQVSHISKQWMNIQCLICINQEAILLLIA